MRRLISILVIGMVLVCQPVFAQGDIPESDIQIRLQLVVDGLTLPVALAAPADGSGRLFIAQQTGEILVWHRGRLLKRPLLDISDRMVNVQHRYDERGLLGIALHPEFNDNGRFFVYYSAPTRPDAPPDTDHTGHISEFRISQQNPNVMDPDSERILLQVDEPFGNHNGGQLEFGPDGYLYIGLGDGGDHGDPFGNAQNTHSLLGKILRIDVDQGDPYAIPPDNPAAMGRPEIYAFGLRNPFRFSFDEPSGLLIAGDVGESRWEEINLIYKGMNYGWNIREGYDCFNFNQFTEPLLTCPDKNGSSRLIGPVMAYDHANGLSVIGGYVYRGYTIPELRGMYVFADWSPYQSIITSSSEIFAAPIEGDSAWEMEELQLVDEHGTPILRNFMINSWGQDAKNELYLLTQAGAEGLFKDGALYKVVQA